MKFETTVESVEFGFPNFENPDLVTVLGTNLPNLRDILPSKVKLEPDSNGSSKYPKTAIGGKIIGLLYRLGYSI